MIKKTITLIALSSVITSTLFAVNINNNSDAINIAGKQRMYSQKLIKDYAMIGMGNTFGSPKEDIKKTISSFSDGLDSLKKYNKDKKIQLKIKETEDFWTPLKKSLSESPDKNKALKLRKDTDKLFNLSNEITEMLSSNKDKSIINISGKQRMLSQKMAALYMFKVWKIKEDTLFEASLNKTMSEFKSNHETLEKYDKNTDKINKNLKNVKRNFKFFEIMSKSKSKFIPSLIYKKSNDIMKKMNETTKLYVKINGGK